MALCATRVTPGCPPGSGNVDTSNQDPGTTLIPELPPYLPLPWVGLCLPCLHPPTQGGQGCS